MDAEDPLKALVVDETELAREALATVLRSFVRFSREGELLPEPAFDALPTRERVACLLLAAKAAFMLGLRPREGATPGELVSMSGMPGGTVRPKLSQLINERLVVRAGNDYLVPAHGMKRVAALLRVTAASD